MLHSWCLFIGFNDSSSCSFVNNGGCQTYQTLTLDNGCWLPPTTHHCSLLLWQCQGAANAAPATLFDSHMTSIFFDNDSHIIGNIPTLYTTNYPLTTNYSPFWSTQSSVGFGYQVIFNQSVYMYLISRNGTILNSVFSDSASMQDFYQRATLDYGGVFRHYLYPKNASSSRN